MQLANNSIQALQQADQSYTSSVSYPSTALGSALRLVAEVITQNLGMKVGHVTLGGFDTHYNENPTLSGLLTTFSDAVSSFYQDLQSQGRDKDVVIMTWSEFGRRVHENGSLGTDHGSAAPMFVFGSPVTGGRYGKPCDLGNLNNGNLVFTTDFRDVYATLIEKWLGAPVAPVLGSYSYQDLSINFKT